MAYRGDRASVALHCEVLERELIEFESSARALDPLLDQWMAAKRRIDEIRRELASTREQLERLGPDIPPLLRNATIASPCPAKWDDMSGDERVRFCKGCSKSVYNLSAMTRADAEALLRERGKNLCVRFFLRADGTILTGDCPVGARKKRVRRRAALALGGGLMAAGAAASWSAPLRKRVSPRMAEGTSPSAEVARPVAPPVEPAPPNEWERRGAPRVTEYVGEVGFASTGPSPRVTLGPGSDAPQGLKNLLTGNLTIEQVRRVVLSHGGAIRACFEAEAQRNPMLRGGVTLTWTIEPSGSVKGASISASTLNDPRLEACILRQVQGWRFPESGGPTHVAAFPFRFEVGG
jgi:hypothetical protein